MEDLYSTIFNIKCREICKKPEHRGKYSVLLEALDLIDQDSVCEVEDNIYYQSISPILREASIYLESLNIKRRISLLTYLDQYDRSVLLQRLNLYCPHGVVFVLEGIEVSLKERTISDFRFYYNLLTSDILNPDLYAEQ